MRRLATVALLLSAGAACSPFGYSERAFYDKLGTISCEKAFECDLQSASETWHNQSNCEEAYSVQAAAWLESYSACEYSRRKAKKYVKAYKKLDCTVSWDAWAELDALWDEVYQCEGGTGAPSGDTGGARHTGDTGL